MVNVKIWRMMEENVVCWDGGGSGGRQILDGDGKDKGIFICIWHWNGGAGRLPEEVKGL